ncbi:40S ribosomal protein S5-1 [Hordeum vulgare]|nr:40S ribosomal protein S5-1 [Hordeum vulgare]
MHEGVLHIHDVEGPKKTGSMETRLKAMEQHVFKCQGMVEQGLNANHMMIAGFIHKPKLDAKDIGERVFKFYEKTEHLQAQIYDLQNQNYEYEYRFKKMSLAADLRIPETHSYFYDGEPMP